MTKRGFSLRNVAKIGVACLVGIMLSGCGGGSNQKSQSNQNDAQPTEQQVSSGNDYKSLAKQGVELLFEGTELKKSVADASKMEALKKKSEALEEKVAKLSTEDKALYDAEFAKLAKEARDKK